MDNTRVTVTSFSDTLQAKAARDRLASVGILAHLEDSPAAVKLEVAEEDSERARELLSRPAEALSDEDEDEEEDDKESDPESAESLATRAWRAAFFGMVILPFLMQIYSLWLLFKLACRDEEVSKAGMRKVYGALAIDGIILLTFALLMRAVSGA